MKKLLFIFSISFFLFSSNGFAGTSEQYVVPNIEDYQQKVSFVEFMAVKIILLSPDDGLNEGEPEYLVEAAVDLENFSSKANRSTIYTPVYTPAHKILTDIQLYSDQQACGL